MSANPINLAARFVLEMAAFAAFGVWGWQLGEGWTRFLFALSAVIFAALMWGVFRVPGDPGPAPVAIPGPLRLALELAVFALATWALAASGRVTAGVLLGGSVVVHYVLSYDRVKALLGR